MKDDANDSRGGGGNEAGDAAGECGEKDDPHRKLKIGLISPVILRAARAVRPDRNRALTVAAR